MSAKMLHRRIREDRAFTLLEVMLAMAILAILIVPLTAAFITSIRETRAATDRMLHSADAQRIAAAWTKDVHSVSPAGVNTPGTCINALPGSDTRPENTLVSFQWNDDPSQASTVPGSGGIEKASWVVKGTGSKAQLLRRHCIAGVLKDEELIATSFGVDDMTTPYQMIHGPLGPNDQAFCNNDNCTIAVSGAFEYSLTVARRVQGVGNPVIVRPDAPTITGALPGNQSLTVTWLPVVAPIDTPPVVGYRVWLTATRGGPEIPGSAFLAGETDTVAQFSGLTNGTPYWVQAQALTDPGFEDSFPSAPYGPATPAPVVPGAPTNAAAVRGDTTAALTWDWSDADDGGSPVTGWVIRARLASTNELRKEVRVSSVNPHSATVTGLDNGTSYTFTVAAVNAVGDGAESQPTTAVIPCGGPAAPDQPSIEDAGSVKVGVSWNSPYDNGCPITSFQIDSDPAFAGDANRPPSPWSTTPVAEGTSAPTTYTTPSLDGLVNYRFRVRGLNSSGIPGAWSDYSESISSIGPPAAKPGFVTVEPDNAHTASNPDNVNAILVTFSAIPNFSPYNGGSPVLGYNVHVSPNDYNGNNLLPHIGAGVFGGPDITVNYGELPQIDDKGTADVWDDQYVDYTVTVGAYNAVGEATAENQTVLNNVRAGGRPTASPTNVQFQGYNLQTDRSGIRVTWDQLPNTVQNNGDYSLTGYLVRWRPANLNGQTQTTISGVATTSANLGDFAKGTNYDFQVVAVNAKGAGISQIYKSTAPTGLVPPAQATVVLSRPAGPTGNRLNLYFPAFTVGAGTPAPTYAASCTVPADGTIAAVNFPGLTPGNNLLDSPSLTNGKAWRCTVTGTSTYPSGPPNSASVQSAGTATPATLSAPPTGLAVTAAAGGKAHIGWTPVPAASNGGDGPTSYVVSVSPALGGFPKEVLGAAATGVDTDTAVPYGTTYTFSVVARNVAGDSAAVSTTYANTQSVPTVAPTNVDYTPLGTPGSVKITWTPIPSTALATGNSPVTKYTVTIRNTAGGTTSSVDVTGAAANQTTFTGFAQLNAGNTAFNDYEVTVTAVNALGAGPVATLGGVRTGGVPLASVTNLTINQRAFRADGSIRLDWAAINFNDPKLTGGDNNGGEAVDWSFDGGTTWSAVQTVGGLNQVTTAIGFSNPGAAIRLRVRLYNSNGTNPVAPATLNGRLPSGPTLTGSPWTLGTFGNPGDGLLVASIPTYVLANDNPTHYDYSLIGYGVTCDASGYPTKTYTWTVSGAYSLSGLQSGVTYTCTLTVSSAQYEGETLFRSNLIVGSKTAKAS